MSDKLDWIFEDPDALESRYDQWAKTYDADHDEWGWRGPEKVSAAALRFQSAGTIFDAGCGTGKVGIALRQAGWAGSIIGIDFSQGMLDVAARSWAYDRLIKGSLYEIDLANDSVTAVVSSGVFTHGHVSGEAFAELCRVTAPGGTVSMTQRLDLTEELASFELGLIQAGKWNVVERTDPELFHPKRDEVEQVIVTWRVTT